MNFHGAIRTVALSVGNTGALQRGELAFRRILEHRAEAEAEAEARSVAVHVHGGFGRPQKALDPKALALLNLVSACGRRLSQQIGWRFYF
ncbi:MAG TPA: hypothetical protein VN110_03195 [Sphingobium sp.]|nr:hypothetical protein [Sphingobium sp.]